MMTSFSVSATYETVPEYSEIGYSPSGPEKEETFPSATYENKLNPLESNTSERNVQKTDTLKLNSYTNYENSESLYDQDENYLSDQSQSSPFISHDLRNEKKSWITKRQALIFSQISLAFTCQASCNTLIFSFFPKETEKKNVTSTQYGLLCGVSSLINILLSPFISKVVSKISLKFLLISGLCLSGCATIFLGTLSKAPPGFTFLGLSFIGRIVQAIGSVSLLILGNVFIANEFTEYRSTALATIEMLFGLGVSLGPAIGGALYEVGGYMLPFFLVGGIILCLSAIMFFLLPETGLATQDNKGEVLKIILNPSFIVAMINVLTAFVILGFNNATLEPHVRQLGLAPSVVGLIFIVSGGMYSVGTLVWGYIYDKTLHFCFPFYTNNNICITGLLIIGPAPFLPLKITLWMVIFSQVLLGIGAGGKTIIGFNYALRSTVCFIGPSLGGALVERLGYENGTMVLLGFELATMAITVLHVLWKKLAKVVKETQEM